MTSVANHMGARAVRVVRVQALCIATSTCRSPPRAPDRQALAYLTPLPAALQATSATARGGVLPRPRDSASHRWWGDIVPAHHREAARRVGCGLRRAWHALAKRSCHPCASPPHKRFLVTSSSRFMRLTKHLTPLRAWCNQCLPGR